jgi:nitrile hydratase
VVRRKFEVGLPFGPHAMKESEMANCACPNDHSGVAIDGYDPAARVKALEQLLVEKGYVDPASLDAIVETYAHEVGPMNGARVVARSWADPAFRERLLADGTAAAAELGYGGRGGEHIIAVENTPKLHNLVVCTLCSCYPWPLLGLPPVWYKSPPYRSRAVMEPRAVLADFGVDLPPSTAIRVWDSTAETRYLVVPMRPAGSEGMSEDELAGLVTREAMIGTGLALAPHRERAAAAE